MPPSLTFDDLRGPHASIPRNPLLAEPLFLTRYIEKAGSGTLDMIDRCTAAGLPEPIFTQRGGQFILTLWRDWLTEAVMEQLGLTPRQKTCLYHVKSAGRITSTDYQRLTGVSRQTAARDLSDLVDQSLLALRGHGRDAYYAIAQRTPKK